MIMKKRNKRKTKKIAEIGLIFTILFILLASVSMSYSSWWRDPIYIEGEINTTEWLNPCLCIKKIIDGSYTNSTNGELLDIPNYDQNQIHSSNNDNHGFPTTFKLKFEITNDCKSEFYNVVVEDIIGTMVAPREIELITHGSVIFNPKGLNRQSFGYDNMTWDIGTLLPGEIAQLTVIIETLPNQSGFYEPTTEDQTLLINYNGAELTAINIDGEIFTTTTDNIILEIKPYGTSDDNLALIESPQLPYETSLVCIDENLIPCLSCDP